MTTIERYADIILATYETYHFDALLDDKRTGDVIFKMDNLETPKGWNEDHATIVAQKYVHPSIDGHSIRNMIHRVCAAITQEGFRKGYFDNPQTFYDELTDIVVKQKAAWNSPVWFNVGVNSPPQVWACLIDAVDDDMQGDDGIINWWATEAQTFIRGSGSGMNASQMRADGEPLSNGKGVASGPMSFIRAADSVAGAIKSGGRTRRAAKMVVMDIDHPDIEEFIDSKIMADDVARVLENNGYDVGINGKHAFLVPYQNANNSVRVTDEFMQAVGNEDKWFLKNRVDGLTAKVVDARKLWDKICAAAWRVGDPGIQFDTTINSFHTIPSRGRIDATNPCGEYNSVKNSVCNLASLNLLAFYDYEKDAMDIDDLCRVSRIMITTMDILVDMSYYPKESVRKNATELRQLGLGFANMGALLMSMGIGYGTERGRSIAAILQSWIAVSATSQSVELASRFGAYASWFEDGNNHIQILKRHAVDYQRWATHVALKGPLDTAWVTTIVDAQKYGIRNSQLTVIAPTGTIGILMGCETTGIEPLYALHSEKELVGGGTFDLNVSLCVERGLRRVVLEHYGTSLEDTEPFYIQRLLDEHEVFSTAVGLNVLLPEDHVKMIAAVQTGVCGAISKTVNMPAEATVDHVSRIYALAWNLKVKAVCVYRNNSKVHQPITMTLGENSTEPVDSNRTNSLPVENSPSGEARHVREALPWGRPAYTQKFRIGDRSFFLTPGFYEDGRLGEMFINTGKEGTFISGMVNAWAKSISIGLQWRVPPQEYADAFIGMKFEPNGPVMGSTREELRFADSMVDWIWKWLTLDEDTGERNPVTLQEVREHSVYEPNGNSSAEMCDFCGNLTMIDDGKCRMCTRCGTTNGGCG